MALKVGINGYGRIGRNILRALYESGRTGDIQIVAINDLGDANINAHLTRYDTAHGRFNADVSVDGDAMVINGDRIKVLSQRDPSKLPWGELGVDIVFECTGIFTSKAKASAHLAGGAKKVLITAPAKGSDVPTYVIGVNAQDYKHSDAIISNASHTFSTACRTSTSTAHAHLPTHTHTHMRTNAHNCEGNTQHATHKTHH
jgi:glyceraldehyde 3-phosphate dehydrogenase